MPRAPAAYVRRLTVTARRYTGAHPRMTDLQKRI
jgi:sirohydrochlorin ferrochelatase